MNNEHIGKIRYCRKDSLGRGRFGSNFRGTYDKLVEVAVKRIAHSEFSIDLDDLRKAQSHQNIPIYYGSDQDVEFM